MRLRPLPLVHLVVPSRLPTRGAALTAACGLIFWPAMQTRAFNSARCFFATTGHISARIARPPSRSSQLRDFSRRAAIGRAFALRIATPSLAFHHLAISVTPIPLEQRQAQTARPRRSLAFFRAHRELSNPQRVRCPSHCPDSRDHCRNGNHDDHAVTLAIERVTTSSF